MAVNAPHEYERVLRERLSGDIPLWKMERDTFGTSHAELGAYLLGLWGLPNAIVEATAFHHLPSLFPERIFGPVAAVHLANVLSKTNEETSDEDVAHMLDRSFLEGQSLKQRLPGWRDTCRSLMQEDAHG
jgi:HD-like signal output (HDOD) protein